MGLILAICATMVGVEMYQNSRKPVPPSPFPGPGIGPGPSGRLPGRPPGPNQDIRQPTRQGEFPPANPTGKRQEAGKTTPNPMRDQRQWVAFDNNSFKKWTKKLAPNPLLNRKLGSLALPDIVDRHIRLAMVGSTNANDLFFLLQARLEESTKGQLEFAERASLAKVFDEQALALFLGKQDLTDNIRVGRLLGADLLLTVASDPGLPGQTRIGISETRMGLTLGRLVVDEKESPDATAQRLGVLVERAMAQLRLPVDQLVVVPQTVSHVLDQENRDLVYAVRRLIESKLTANAGVLAVELKDAGSITAEWSLPTQTPAGSNQPASIRPIPVFFTSTLEETPDKDKFIVGLKVQQAQDQIGDWKSGPVTRDQLAGAVGDLVSKASAARKLELLAGDSAYEEMQLLNKTREYYLLGEYESALETVNALLIVSPQDAYRVLALDLVTRIIDARYRPGAAYDVFEKTARESIDLWLQSRHYVDTLTPEFTVYSFDMEGKSAFIRRSEAVHAWIAAINGYRIDNSVQGKANQVAVWLEKEVLPAQQQIAKDLGIHLSSMWNLLGSTDHRYGLETVYDPLPQSTAWGQAPPRLETLDLKWRDGAGQEYLIQPTGWIQAGDKTDFIWERHARHACYLIKNGVISTPLDLQTLPVRADGSPTSDGPYWSSFDGRFIWVPVVSSTPAIHVLDPATGQTITFTRDDGLLPMDRRASACGIAPGKAIVVGSYDMGGKTPQTWAALLSIQDDGKKHFKLITRLGAVSNLFNEPWRGGETNLAFDPGWSLKTTTPALDGKPQKNLACFATRTGKLFTIDADDLSFRTGNGLDASTQAFPPCITWDQKIVRGGAHEGWYPYVSIHDKAKGSTRFVRSLQEYHSFVQHKGVIVGANRKGSLGVLSTDESTMSPLLGDTFETPDTVLWNTSNYGPIFLAPERPESVYVAFKVKLPELDAPVQASSADADPAKEIILDVRIWNNAVVALTPAGVRVGQLSGLNKGNNMRNMMWEGTWIQLRIDGKTISFPGRTVANRQGQADLGLQYPHPFPDITSRRIEIVSVAANPADLDKPGIHILDSTRPTFEKAPISFIRGDLPGMTVLTFAGKADRDWVRLKIHPPAPSSPKMEAPQTQNAPWDNIPLTKRNDYIWEFTTPGPADKTMWISLQQEAGNFRSNADFIIDPDGRMWIMPVWPGVHRSGRTNLEVPRAALSVGGLYRFVQFDYTTGIGIDVSKYPMQYIALIRERSEKNMIQPPVTMVSYQGKDGQTRQLRLAESSLALNSGAQNGSVDFVKRMLDEYDNLGGIDKDGSIALGKAATPEIAKILIDAGLPVDYASPESGATIAHWLVSAGRVATLKYLVDEHGLDLGALDKAGNGVWHYAAMPQGLPADMEAMMRFLHERKLNINLANSQGRTPLMTLGSKSVPMKYKDVPKLFLDLGADKSLKDNQGMTAAEITSSRFIREVIETGQTPDIEKFRRSAQTQPSAAKPPAPLAPGKGNP